MKQRRTVPSGARSARSSDARASRGRSRSSADLTGPRTMSERQTREDVAWLPCRRPADAVFLAIVRGAHLELGGHERSRSRYHQGPTSHAIVATVAAFLIVASAGTAAALSATSESPTRTVPACAPIHYVVNPQRSPDGASDAVHEAFRRLADATGRAAVFDGLTTEEPSPPWLLQTDARPVLVAWIDAEILEVWSGRPGPLGFAQSDVDEHGGAVVSATVSLNGDVDLPADFSERSSWGGVLMHELGHVVGLAHSVDRADVMFADVDHGAAEWSAIDRMRLAAVGARAGCSS